ncbi:hypothetical protein Glove_8g50 [Diversispora epigaea]|uniref:Uncharacterized protein n=1 Tax=Diversispora epigaea TaxID=1348612 RepID=A0A397JRN7_9GLOM|nr:hypothetical protein Glove_8g50 [Diversispora epigaea]
MSALSYQIPVNTMALQPLQNEPATNILSTSSQNVAEINPLPQATIKHLDNIFEAVKRQVAIWGEHARWKIDLVLLPDEDLDAQNRMLGASPSIGMHSPISEPTPLSSVIVQDSKNQITNRSEGDILNNNLRRFSSLESSCIDNLDAENAKHLLKETINQIRNCESIIERTNEYEERIKDLDDKLKKANEHVEGIHRYHTMREEEMTVKHNMELRLLQEDARILNQRLRETTSKLESIYARHRSKRRERSHLKDSKDLRDIRGRSLHHHIQSDRQLTNGYITYNNNNYPYGNATQMIIEGAQTNARMPTIQTSTTMISTIQENSTNTIHSNYPSMLSSQSNDVYTTPPMQTNSTISSYHLYPTYTFSPTINQNRMQNTSIQYDNTVTNIPPEMLPYHFAVSSSYAPNHLIGSSSFFPMSQIKQINHSGLDNLSLAAEMILNSNNQPVSYDNNESIKNETTSNACVGTYTNQSEDNKDNKDNEDNKDNKDNEDNKDNNKDNEDNEDNKDNEGNKDSKHNEDNKDELMNNQQSNVEVHRQNENEESFRSVLTTPESLMTIRNGNGLVEDTEDENTVSTPVSGAVDDGRSCNFEVMETGDNLKEQQEQGETNVEVLSTSTFENESSDET